MKELSCVAMSEGLCLFVAAHCRERQASHSQLDLCNPTLKKANTWLEKNRASYLIHEILAESLRAAVLDGNLKNRHPIFFSIFW